MAKKKKHTKTMKQMTAEELYKLAQQREVEEQEREREAVRAELDGLRAERRELVARHRKELGAVERRIRKLSGKTRGRASGGGATEAVLAILGKVKQTSTREIRAELGRQGIDARHLAQTLAYLKRQGRVKSPSRAVYALAKKR